MCLSKLFCLFLVCLANYSSFLHHVLNSLSTSTVYLHVPRSELGVCVAGEWKEELINRSITALKVTALYGLF